MIERLEDIAGLTVTVMGLGLNGGGLASARFFAEHGAKKVIVTDMKSEAELAASVEPLRRYSAIRFALGGHCIDDFRNTDIVIKNPGIKAAGNPYLAAAPCIETDISLFLRLSPAPVIAVTGSKGKSSTVSALHHGLQTCGVSSFLGGNITVSPLTFLEQTSIDTPVVLELSSWQLGDLADCRNLRPKIALITPVMPDHQNWYGSMERYVADKKIIYRNQTAGDCTICNYDDEWGAVFASETAGQVFWYSAHPLPDNLFGAWIAEDGSARIRLVKGQNDLLLPAALAVPGAIFKQNVAAAALALALYGVDLSAIPQAMQSYGGIPHRLEFFHQKDGWKFYNDSAATIPEAASAAVQAFSEPVILIAGGTDKDLDFTPLLPQLHNVKGLFLLAGTGTDKLLPLLHDAHIPYQGPFTGLAPLLDALYADISKSGQGTVVFSPAATSFGLFKNEFDRGNQFKEEVRKRWSAVME